MTSLSQLNFWALMASSCDQALVGIFLLPQNRNRTESKAKLKGHTEVKAARLHRISSGTQQNPLYGFVSGCSSSPCAFFTPHRLN